jgi:hypothetical protein
MDVAPTAVLLKLLPARDETTITLHRLRAAAAFSRL